MIFKLKVEFDVVEVKVVDLFICLVEFEVVYDVSKNDVDEFKRFDKEVEKVKVVLDEVTVGVVVFK